MKKILGSLKICKCILLKRAENLSEKQKIRLIKLKEASLKLASMYDLKEEFTEIFDKSDNLGEGTINLLNWLEKAWGGDNQPETHS